MNYDIPRNWSRLGLVLARDESAGISSVAGDPCIVWDDDVPGWRMVLFFSPPRHAHASGSYGKEQLYVKLSEKCLK